MHSESCGRIKTPHIRVRIRFNMFQAINNYVIVKAPFNDNFNHQILESEVVATTEETQKLLGKTVLANRHKYLELGETEEEAKTDSGILLGSKNKYASLKIDDIIAIRHEKASITSE